MVDIEADHLAIGVYIDDQAFDNFSRLGAGRALQLDIEAVRFRDNSAVSFLFLPEVPVEERVMDGLAVLQCNNPEKSRSAPHPMAQFGPRSESDHRSGLRAEAERQALRDTILVSNKDVFAGLALRNSGWFSMPPRAFRQSSSPAMASPPHPQSAPTHRHPPESPP